VQVGANQIPIPVGDEHHVTCGPFGCAAGMDAPEVTIEDSAKCTAWEPNLVLDIGLIDNDLDSHAGEVEDPASTSDTDATLEVEVFDGLDLGWRYSSNLGFTPTHDLAVVEEKGKAEEADSNEPMMSASVGKIQVGDGDDPDTYFAIAAHTANTTGDRVGACQPVSEPTGAAGSGGTRWGYNNNITSRIDQPENCFRLTVDKELKRNYLDAYTVTLDPDPSADVSWGKVNEAKLGAGRWKAWEDLTCRTESWEAAAQVDVCAMFDEEVDRLPMPMVIPVVSTNTTPTNVAGNTLVGFKLHFKDAAASRHRFTAMWYERSDAGEAEDPPPNLYSDTSVGGTDSTVVTHVKDFVVGAALSTTNFTIVPLAGAALAEYGGTDVPGIATASAPWVLTVDEDFDPIYGDLGKVDTGGDDRADNYTAGDDSNLCDSVDGGVNKTKDVADGTLCNASREMETTVTFPLGLGYGCDAVEKTYVLKCEWNARGQGSNVVATPPTGLTAENVHQFVECNVVE
jgi:hypothetical protein